MYQKDKRSFFEKLTGAVNINEDDFMEEDAENLPVGTARKEEPSHAIYHSSLDEQSKSSELEENWEDDNTGNEEDGELTVDVYQTNSDIIIQAMVAGVNPQDLDISITRDMVIIKGKRVAPTDIAEDAYFHKELYWGKFSRRILLPEEIDSDLSEAVEKHGLLMLKLQKIDKKKVANLKVKSA